MHICDKCKDTFLSFYDSDLSIVTVGESNVALCPSCYKGAKEIKDKYNEHINEIRSREQRDLQDYMNNKNPCHDPEERLCYGDGWHSFTLEQAREFLDNMANKFHRAHWTGIFRCADDLLKMVGNQKVLKYRMQLSEYETYSDEIKKHFEQMAQYKAANLAVDYITVKWVNPYQIEASLTIKENK